MKYRKNPVEIEAIQYTGTKWSQDEVSDFMDMLLHIDGDRIIIPTLEGDIYASPLDFIIRGVKGELYPCKPDIFEMTYEKVDEPKT